MMAARLPYRSQHADWLIVGGWLIIMAIGQAVIPVEAPALEWLSIAWLVTGMALVRRGTCLPLLLLTCPTFLCNPVKDWAWAQPLAALAFLARILLDSRKPAPTLLRAALAGTIVGWASWPSNPMPLLRELSAFNWSKLLIQWLHPSAPWAIFPFRQSADRALLAMLLAAILTNRSFIHTPRLWRALLGVGFFPLGVSILSALVPWHAPHVFLGTTNYASYGSYLLHGPGDNACHLPILLAVALPWLLVPLNHRRPWLHLGLIGLLPPLYFLLQRSLYLMAGVLLVCSLLFTFLNLADKKLRKRLKHRLQSIRTTGRPVLLLALACLFITLAWGFRMGFADPKSSMRETLRYALAHHGNPKTPAPAYGALSSIPAPDGPSTMATPVHWTARLESLLVRSDPARASMWTLGIRHALHDGLWHGQGAGTWARFHRDQPRPDRMYFAHMHNTYLDLIFEYGLIPMLCIFAWIGFCLVRLVGGCGRVPRNWILYFAGLGAVAAGQHLFFPFSYQCLLIPGILILSRLTPRIRFTRAQPSRQEPAPRPQP